LFCDFHGQIDCVSVADPLVIAERVSSPMTTHRERSDCQLTPLGRLEVQRMVVCQHHCAGVGLHDWLCVCPFTSHLAQIRSENLRRPDLMQMLK
jgi:hypothetical protein